MDEKRWWSKLWQISREPPKFQPIMIQVFITKVLCYTIVNTFTNNALGLISVFTRWIVIMLKTKPHVTLDGIMNAKCR